MPAAAFGDRIAARALATCAHAFVAAPTHYESALCFYRVGTQHNAWPAAHRSLKTQLEAFPEAGALHLMLGHIDWYDERLRSAEDAYRIALALFQKNTDHKGELIAHGNLINLLHRTGRKAQIRPHLIRVEQIVKHSTDQELQVRGLTLLAQQALNAGADVTGVYRALLRIEPQAQALHNYLLHREVLRVLGAAALELGHFHRAQGHYNALERISTEQDDRPTANRASYDLANAQLELALDEPATQVRQQITSRAEAVLANHQPGDDPILAAATHRLLGELQSDHADAQQHFNACTQIAAANNDDAMRSECLWNQAWSLVAVDPERAEALAANALELVTGLEDLPRQIHAWRYLMRIRWQTQPPAVSMRSALEALDTLERLRRQQPSFRSQAEVLGRRLRDYEWLVGALLQVPNTDSDEKAQRQRLTTAFHVMERRRGQTLLTQLRNRTASSYPKLGSPTTLPKLTQIEHALGQHQAMLSFQVAAATDLFGDSAGGSWVLLSTSSGTKAFALPNANNIKAAIDLTLGALQRNDSLYRTGVRTLYSQLLSEALATLPSTVSELVLVLDSELRQVPFALLQAEAEQPGLPLRFSLTIAPSAATWLHWQSEATPHAPAKALILADPLRPDGDTTNSARWTAQSEMPLPALPAARAEATTVVRILGNHSQPLFGADASERRLKLTNFDDYGVLHVAAHALDDVLEPDQSALVLSPGASGEDGLLQYREVIELPLNGQLVSLLACRSAMGPDLRTEGVMSISRAFLAAGASAVLGSLQPLADNSAAQLSNWFYQGLASGKNATDALRDAQRQAQAQRLPINDWANLILLGDGSFTLANAPEARSRG